MTKSHPYLNLVYGSERSLAHWKRFLGGEELERLVRVGALAKISTEDHAGETAWFESPYGYLECDLTVQNGTIKAKPQTGEASFDIGKDEGIFSADLRKLVMMIFTANDLKEDSPHADQSPFVFAGAKQLENGDLFRVVIAYDENWLTTTTGESILRKMALGAHSIIICKPNAGLSIIWDSRDKAILQLSTLPSENTGWKIPREFFFNPRVGTDEATLLSIFSDKDLIIDEFRQVIYLLGKKLSLKWGNAPADYLIGLTRMASRHIREVTSEVFCKEYLRWESDKVSMQGKVRDTKRNIKERIEEVFTGKDRELAFKLVRPLDAKNMVKTGFELDDFIIFEAQT